MAMKALQTGLALAAAHATGRAVPFHVSIYPTMRCNLRCVYCSSPYQETPELTTEEWCGIFDNLKAAGTTRIAFLGGEPLLRRDIDRLVGHARSLGLAAAMTSNGTLVPQREETVRMLDGLTISMDGSSESHDRNRGQGSHAEALRAVEAARKWGVPVKLNAVLNDQSAETLEHLLAFVRREDLPLTINFMRSDEGAGLWHDASRHRLADERIRALCDRIVEARRTHPMLVFSEETYRVARQWTDYRRDRLSASEAGVDFPGPRCSAGRFHCAIAADGKVYPCALTLGRVPARNIREHGAAASLEVSRQHGCATCYSPCMLEQNALFALQPGVVANLLRLHLRRRLL